MIFVVEHKRDGVLQVETVICEDLNTEQYQPVQKIFLCDSMEEAQSVVDELNQTGRIV